MVLSDIGILFFSHYTIVMILRSHAFIGIVVLNKIEAGRATFKRIPLTALATHPHKPQNERGSPPGITVGTPNQDGRSKFDQVPI